MASRSWRRLHPTSRSVAARLWSATRGRLGAGISRLDNNADGFLVEAFEAAFALEVFQVAADGAFGDKSVELRLVDMAALEQRFGAFAAHRPAFAFGEGLFQEWKIGERSHRVDVLGRQLLAQQRVIEPAFQVVHPGLEKALAMQTNPEPNRAQPFRRGQPKAGKVNLRLVGFEVHIAKGNNSLDRLFEDLRAPTGLRTGVVTFPAFEAEFLQALHQIDEMIARRAERVMVVIRPAEPKAVLAAFLHLRGTVAALPIEALLGKDHMACPVSSNAAHKFVKQGVCLLKIVVLRTAIACAPEFVCP